jgi:allantoin racemase
VTTAMKIFVVNPNITRSMTERIGAAARRAASPGTTIVAVNPVIGPASIEGYYDEALSVPGLIQEIIKAEIQGADAHIIACFDDTGLDAARSCAVAPVVGIGESAFHLASLISHRFSVITTLSRSIAAIETNLMKYGLERRCAKVRAVEIPVLALENDDVDVRRSIGAEIERAKQEERADAIVLGCAGMTHLAADLLMTHSLPVVDGVGAAVKLAESLVSLGFKTSKHGPYAPPSEKTYGGILASFAPARPKPNPR